MQQLNYCRQILGQCHRMLAIPSLPEEKRKAYLHMADLCQASQKFLLPPGGVLLRDDEFRALDTDQQLRLPHPFTAIEYESQEFEGRVIAGSKMTLLCRQHDDVIWVTPISFENGVWGWGVAFSIDRTGCFRRVGGGIADQRFAVATTKPAGTKDVPDSAPKLYFEFYKVVLAFLNALACSNVKAERIEPKRTGTLRRKDALSFDTYHVLTIEVPGRQVAGSGPGGSHRSPREHLRRGHIRRFEDGRRPIWINATVVNPGVGGKVQKDYRLAA